MHVVGGSKHVDKGWSDQRVMSASLGGTTRRHGSRVTTKLPRAFSAVPRGHDLVVADGPASVADDGRQLSESRYWTVASLWSGCRGRRVLPWEAGGLVGAGDSHLVCATQPSGFSSHGQRAFLHTAARKQGVVGSSAAARTISRNKSR